MGRAEGRSKRETVIEESKPYILCMFANVLYAGYNVICKLALNQSMSQYVLVVYGNAIGTIATGLLAFAFERFLKAFIIVVIVVFVLIFY